MLIITSATYISWAVRATKNHRKSKADFISSSPSIMCAPIKTPTRGLPCKEKFTSQSCFVSSLVISNLHFKV